MSLRDKVSTLLYFNATFDIDLQFIFEESLYHLELTRELALNKIGQSNLQKRSVTKATLHFKKVVEVLHICSI